MKHLLSLDGPESASEASLFNDAGAVRNEGTGTQCFERTVSCFNSLPPLMPHHGQGPIDHDGGFYLRGGAGTFSFYDGHAESRVAEDMVWGDATRPFDRPSAGQRREWNLFVNGNDSPTAC